MTLLSIDVLGLLILDSVGVIEIRLLMRVQSSLHRRLVSDKGVLLGNNSSGNTLHPIVRLVVAMVDDLGFSMRI